ncbi:hypothetical protein B7P43_G05034 [Cryptotermes secundus]|uniref:Uncharacterized protein n=1 Tax=Cryptotermes secundus TaxID=105785 RepID=A0A2J7PQV7_9NEOP|nr:hypothetical protein B7P43_G05034 [Cryptotermes secundus]
MFAFNAAKGSVRGSLEELRALKELTQLKDLKGSSGMNRPSSGGPHHSTESGPTKIVPGAVTFQNTEAMTRMSSVSPVGTIAYIIDEEALLVRVNNGWQYIALGGLLPITTQPPPTTTPHSVKPPFEASNLINTKPIPVEGPSLRMAALNEPCTGDMTGVRGADYSCYRESRRAGLRGTFRAFLSSRVQNLDSIVRFSDRELPVVNIKGEVLFNSWKDMFNGDGGFFSQQARIYSFSGKNILTDFAWPQKIVWHGSHLLGERAMDTYCDAWHSASTDKVGLASSLLKNKLLDQERYSCNNRFAVLCIEATSQYSRRRRRRNADEDKELSEGEYQVQLEELISDKGRK